MMAVIVDFNSFVRELLHIGFSGAVFGAKDVATFSLFNYGWSDEVDGEIVWHTGSADTDPWEWRMRVLEERDDIAYAKLFFKRAGYITREWYPIFLSARRRGLSFAEVYAEGSISYMAKLIYEAVATHGRLPLQDIKYYAGISKKEASRFDSTLAELQTRMYLTIAGREVRQTRKGDSLGWSSTVFCTTEEFFGEEVAREADDYDPDEAYRLIEERLYQLNPKAEPKRVRKFILG